MTIKTFTDLAELEALRAYWEGWQKHPNSDFSHFQLICRLRPEVLHPHVTVVEREGEPYALLAARLERTHFRPSIGYLKTVRLPATALMIIHQGFLGHADEEVGETIVPYLWSILGRGEADLVVFHHLPEDSPLRQALLGNGNRWGREKKQKWLTHWEMTLPEEPGALLGKFRSKHRSWIRGRQKQLESTFRGKVSWQWIVHFDDIPGFCARLEDVAARTYQRGLRAGFVDDEEHRQRFALFARQRQLRAQLLEIDGKIRAFWIGIVYKGVFYSSETGYDPDLREYEVGTLILVRMLEELIREGVMRVDFGLGDAFYKKRFGDRSWREATVRIFAPTPRGLFLWFALGLFSRLDDIGRGLAERLGVVNRLKTGWRRNLAGKKGEESKEDHRSSSVDP